MGRRRNREKDHAPPRLAADHPLTAVIEDAYRVFGYDTPEETGVCKWCCMEPEIERDFFRPRVREMPMHYLRDWFFAACEPPLPKRTWGYLLPRVMEALAADEEPASVGLEVSLSRFPTGDASQWMDAEWQVIDRFQRQYLDWFVDHGQEFLDTALCMFHSAGWEIGELLGQVEAFEDARLFGRLHRDWVPERGGAIWVTAFWERGGNEAAYAWYTGRALYDRAAAHGLDPATPRADADKALAVADMIAAHADWA